jgi:hypothetical protein
MESDLISARGRAGAASADEPTEPDWQEARRLRQLVMGEALLTDGEAGALRRFAALGGRMRDLADAVAWWRKAAAEGQAPKELWSFCYVIRIAVRAVQARRKPAAAREMGQAPAGAIRIAPRLTPEQQAAEYDARQRARGYVSIGEVMPGKEAR